ncbi:benenodin family lasso peptide [Sphingomonas sp. QA11]|nr:benenodin family lasso peptide [Sphingomonas sp. QA11]WCM25933.1 benenodin family lasso peptide [Sphingomonas sp. QA11]
MNREDQSDIELVDLGTATGETKGPPAVLQIDQQGNFGALGLSDD